MPLRVPPLQQVGELLVVGHARRPVEHDNLRLHAERVDRGVEVVDDVSADSLRARRVREHDIHARPPPDQHLGRLLVELLGIGQLLEAPSSTASLSSWKVTSRGSTWIGTVMPSAIDWSEV